MKIDTLLLPLLLTLGTNAVATTNTNLASNPFSGTHQYVNADYQASVTTFFNANADYVTKAQAYLDNNQQWNTATAVWIDRKAAINGFDAVHGLEWHLTQALAQATTNTPTVITFVVYDLPDRDCAAYSSNGEIVAKETSQVASALSDYEHNYIDAFNTVITSFYAANADAAAKVKIVLLIEPDSLPNMITNAGVNNGSSQYPTCQFVNQNRLYVQGIAYALKAFSSNPYASSLSLYLDSAHSGWMGWQTNINQFANIYNNTNPLSNYGTESVYGGLGSGFDSVRGFVVNTANYTPLKEAFTYSRYLDNNAIISTAFYQWNDVYSLDAYIAEIMSIDSKTHTLLMQNGGHQITKPASALYQDKHFVIDTSRNGWKKTTSAIDALGNPYARYEQRTSNANWCNVQNIQLSDGSTTSPGLGEVPQADPILANPLYSGNLPIDAYVFVKPPGESDGNYDATTGTGDQMCSNGTGGFHNGSVSTDSLQNGSAPAPSAGAWFEGAFKALLNNT